MVLAAGAWTTPLAHSIGVSIPMEAGKGYSFSIRPDGDAAPRDPALGRARRRARPYGDRVRIGGTMEFSGINNRLDRRRIDAIVTGARADVHALADARRSRTSGPACGRSPPTGCRSSTAPASFDNTYIATGYAMQGDHAGADRGARAGRDDRDRQPAGDAGAVPARPLRARPAAHRRALERQARGSRVTKLRVAIIGSGNIGTDLMMKIARSPSLELVRGGGHRPGVRRPAQGARARHHRLPRRARGPARAGRRHRPRVRCDLGRCARASTRGCWPRAASAAST